VQGNPVCCSAGLAVLDTIRRDGLDWNAADVGDYLQSQLRSLTAEHPLISDVRGRGLAVGVELVNPDTAAPAALETSLVVYRALELGLVLFYVGVHSNVLEFTPPLTLSRSEVDEGVAILGQAIGDVSAGRVDPAVVAPYAGW
jgi:4-aminobutyrate aminotransferase